jgi:hypothetical protein
LVAGSNPARGAPILTAQQRGFFRAEGRTFWGGSNL